MFHLKLGKSNYLENNLKGKRKGYGGFKMPTGVYTRTEEHRKKIGLGNKGKSHSQKEETKKKLSLINKGKHHSKDTEFKKGLIPWNKGLTKERDERLKKLSQSHIGKKYSEETREKISNSKKGKTTKKKGK